ncbi:hypothetical protein [Rhizobium sp. 12,4]|uniref:hypothetical protein n=1 Tax=Rhizobium sp. 12,4 TaxID=3405135 RepID=UPI003D339F36
MIGTHAPTTIGELERLAGVNDRVTFWRSFASNGEGFRLGVAELKRRIAATGAIRCTEVAACRQCGCTDDRACMTEHGPCHWVEADLCSACAPTADKAVAA